jgi:hypothetical protein
VSEGNGWNWGEVGKNALLTLGTQAFILGVEGISGFGSGGNGNLSRIIKYSKKNPTNKIVASNLFSFILGMSNINKR